MEGGIEHGMKNDQKYPIENAGLFGETLSKAHGKVGSLSLKETAKMCDVKYSAVEAWQKGTSLPSEDRLPFIAKAYGINYETLKIIFNVSENARKAEKESRKSIKTRKDIRKEKTDDAMFSGSMAIARAGHSRPRHR